MIAETASSVLGWISIATWVVVYSPQIYENYKLKSGEGLSIPFVVIWLLGDITNLAGAALAGLLPTMILLAVWYTFCDTILLVQVYYYRWCDSHKHPVFIPDDRISAAAAAAAADGDENTPLLPESSEIKPRERTEISIKKEVLTYVTAIAFIIAAGVVAWAVSEYAHEDEETASRVREVIEWRSQIMGWISAVLYLGSRIPQILKNFETRCEGLSPGLFIFSIMGNATYAGSILVVGIDWDHLIVNASWLAGSALTIFLDVFVLGQFVRYRRQAAGVASVA